MTDTDSYDEFLERYCQLIEELAAVGWTPSEVYTRFTTLYPDESRELIARALDSTHWNFETRKEHMVNHTMLAAALWYAVGVTYDLEPDPAYTAISLDPVILQDVPRLFETAGVSQQSIALVLSRMGAGLKYLAENPYTILDEATYDDFLENLPPEAQGISDGVMVWPPSRLIIGDRLGEGSWSQALLRVGVCPPDIEELGLNLTGSKLSDRSFRNALGEFLSYCIRYDRKPTVLLYGSWSVAPAQLGRVPLIGAVRGKYGSWYRALKLGRLMVNDALRMSAASAVPASSRQNKEATDPLQIEYLKAQGIGVVSTDQPSAHHAHKRAWDELSSVMLTRLAELPWSHTMSVYYICPEVVDTGDYTPYARILRSPAGYLCELSAPEAFESITPKFNTEYLAEAGWIAPQPSGYPVFSQNFFDVTTASESLLAAMRQGMGCERPDYFQSDDPANAPVAEIANPSTGSIPMVPVDTPKVTFEWE